MKTLHVNRFRFLFFHGVMMLFLGAALSLLAELMINQSEEKVSYIIALLLVLTAICEPVLLSVRSMWFRSNPRRFLISLLLTGIVMFAGTLALFVIRQGSSSLSAILILAGVMGLFWGTWHIMLAQKLTSFPKTSAFIVIKGAVSAAFGSILCSQTDISAVSAVTAVACYSTWIGIAMLSIAPIMFWNWRYTRPIYSPGNL